MGGGAWVGDIVAFMSSSRRGQCVRPGRGGSAGRVERDITLGVQQQEGGGHLGGLGVLVRMVLLPVLQRVYNVLLSQRLLLGAQNARLKPLHMNQAIPPSPLLSPSRAT